MKYGPKLRLLRGHSFQTRKSQATQLTKQRHGKNPLVNLWLCQNCADRYCCAKRGHDGSLRRCYRSSRSSSSVVWAATWPVTDCSRQESLHDFENSAGVEVHIERAPCSLVRERAVHRIALQVKKIPRSLIEPPGCTCGGISHANFDLPALHAGLNACSRLEQTYPQAA